VNGLAQVDYCSTGNYLHLCYTVLDSSTKVPEGILEGTFTHMGNFEECLEVNVKEEWGSFKGQHCLVDVDTKVHIPVTRNQVR
jgi:hypothetical protein